MNKRTKTKSRAMKEGDKYAKAEANPVRQGSVRFQIEQ